ncbi:hypothetical protein U1Q18_029189 [Sarracenia purpurea var. burkii]
MDLETGVHRKEVKKESWRTVLTLAYQSLGVVYGDLSTSPLYVYKNTFAGDIEHSDSNEEIYGVLSFVFWTLTLIPLLKYVFIVLRADDNGEGGTFALYSLLCRHARINSLPNSQLADEELSAYKKGITVPSPTTFGSRLKSTLESHRILQKSLLVLALIGTCMVIGDGVLSPAISGLAVITVMLVTTCLMSLKDDMAFEKDLVCSIAEFIRTGKLGSNGKDTDLDIENAKMAVVGSPSTHSECIQMCEDELDYGEVASTSGLKEIESPVTIKSRKRVRFVIPESPGIDTGTQEELRELMEAREAGVAYILGHSYVRAKHGSSRLKKLIINYGYDFLRRNSRAPTYALNVPHASTLEVGMAYHI